MSVDTVNAPAPATTTAPATESSPSITEQFSNIISQKLSTPEPPASGQPPATPAPGTQTVEQPADPNVSQNPETLETSPELEPELVEDADFENQTVPIDPNSTRGKQLWAEHQFYRKLTAPVQEGGLGHEPTLQDLSTYFQSHVTRQQIDGDLASGSVRFLEGFGQYQPQAFAEVLSKVPEFLMTGLGASEQYNQVFEPVREAMSNAVLNSVVDNYMNAARTAATPELRKQFLDRAKFIAQDFLSKNISDADLNVTTDPLEAERKRLADERKRLDESRMQEANRVYGIYDQRCIQQLGPVLKDAALTYLKPFENHPVFKQAQRELMEQSVGFVDASPMAQQEIQAIRVRVQRAIQSGQANPQWLGAMEKHLTQTIMKYARPHMARIRVDVAKNFGLMKGTSPGQKRPEPSRVPGTTMTTQAAVSAPPSREKGESFEDYGKRSLMSALNRIQ